MRPERELLTRERARGRSVGGLRLLAACAEPGCPVCRSLEADGRRHVEALAHEHVTDVETRRRLRASRGLCGWHAAMLLGVPGARSGTAIVYEDMLRVAIHLATSLRDGLRRGRRRVWRERLSAMLRLDPPRPGPRLAGRRRSCHVCARAAAAEETSLQALLRLTEDPELGRAYDRSDGLCVPHALLAVERGGGRPGADELLGRTLPKWEALRERLGAFIASHGHGAAAPLGDEAARSCARAVETVAGAAGVWGNDLPRGALTPGRRPPTIRRLHPR